MVAQAPLLYRYQFSEEDVGKLRKESKKSMTWTFQRVIPSADGTAPLTNTHSVSLIWSVKTGKQEVIMDDEQIWFGRQQGAAVFSHAWRSRQGLKLEVMATTRTVPSRHVAPDFRHHDLVINGQLFDKLPGVGDFATAVIEPDGERALDLPRSIIEILYPQGYTWKESPGATMLNDPDHTAEYDDYPDPENVERHLVPYYAAPTPAPHDDYQHQIEGPTRDLLDD